MLQVSNCSVLNLENAIRGARNPLNSWERSDSSYDEKGEYILGKNDLELAKKLCNAGSDHRKFMRQIFVSIDILAPLYWWKEFDTYKVGTVSNSTSTMHRIHKKPIEISDFSFEELDERAIDILKTTIDFIEKERNEFTKTNDKKHWYNIIQLLPSSYNQLRTCTLTYETLTTMYKSRKAHKLHEWNTLCAFIEGLPYAKELICN
jgi:hypothetical protein